VQKLTISSLFERVLQRLTLVTVLMIVVSASVLPHFINPDVAMYSEIGHKLLDGERPYVDYEETNFPMIHVLNILPAALTRLTGLPATVSLQICLIALLLLSLGMTWQLLKTYSESRAVAAVTLLGVAMLAWVLLIGFHWGEREHIYSLLYLPFVILRVMRREDKPVKRGMALAVGLMAGVGVALKPYFILTAILVEGVGLLTTRRWNLRTPEVGGVLAMAALHGLYFGANPDVLSAFLLLIQRLSAGYAVYAPTPWDKLISLMVMSVLITAVPFILAALRYRYRIVPARLMITLAVMGVGSIIGFLLQGKGWNYHSIPFVTTNVVISLLLITEGFLGYSHLMDVRRQNLVRLTLVSLGVSFAIGMGIFEVMSVRRALVATREFELFTLAPYLSAYTDSGDRVMVAHAEIMPTYPVLAALNRRSASRYAFAHPIPIAYATYAGAPLTDPAHVVPDYAQEYLDAFVADMALYRPKLVLIHEGGCLPPCAIFNGDMIDYLTERGLIDRVITPDYTLVGVDGGFYIFVRKGVQPRP